MTMSWWSRNSSRLLRLENVVCLGVFLLAMVYICSRLQNRTAVLAKPELKIVYPKNLNVLLEDSEMLSDFSLVNQLFDYIEKPQLGCRILKQYGGVKFVGDKLDGDKFVCQDEPFTLVAGQCLVYSVGINNEWSFDKAMIKLGCQVHAFDPSMTKFKANRTYFGAFFYRLGLAGSSKRENNGWQMSTLTDIRIKLGHTDKLIDYLKVDIEGGEWSFLEHDLSSLRHVKQFGMEIHMSRNIGSYRRYHRLFQRLQQLGFRTVHSVPNRVFGKNGHASHVSRAVGHLYELVWLNTAPQRP